MAILAREIDAREIPAGWKTGYLPLRGIVPYEQPGDSSEGEVYRLDPGLVEWAFRLTGAFRWRIRRRCGGARSPYLA
jgi:purine nucleoside permease